MTHRCCLGVPISYDPFTPSFLLWGFRDGHNLGKASLVQRRGAVQNEGALNLHPKLNTYTIIHDYAFQKGL